MKRKAKVHSTSETIISVSSKFIYEVSVYRLYKGWTEFVGNKYYSSKSEIRIRSSTIYTKKKDFIVMKSIDLIGAPLSFIKTSNKYGIEEIHG